MQRVVSLALVGMVVCGCGNGKSGVAGSDEPSSGEAPAGGVAIAGDLSSPAAISSAISSHGISITADELCVKRSKTFAAIAVGSLATDHGCKGGRVIHGGWLFADGKLGMVAVLAGNGFAKASADGKAEMVLTYLTEMSFSRPITDTQQPEGFEVESAPPYHPPKVESLPGGEIKVTAWYFIPRMTPGVSYQLVESRYDQSGMPLGGDVVLRHEVDR